MKCFMVGDDDDGCCVVVAAAVSNDWSVFLLSIKRPSGNRNAFDGESSFGGAGFLVTAIARCGEEPVT